MPRIEVVPANIEIARLKLDRDYYKALCDGLKERLIEAEKEIARLNRDLKECDQQVKNLVKI